MARQKFHGELERQPRDVGGDVALLRHLRATVEGADADGIPQAWRDEYALVARALREGVQGDPPKLASHADTDRIAQHPPLVGLGAYDAAR